MDELEVIQTDMLSHTAARMDENLHSIDASNTHVWILFQLVILFFPRTKIFITYNFDDLLNSVYFDEIEIIVDLSGYLKWFLKIMQL